VGGIFYKRKSKRKRKRKMQQNNYHLVTASPWPVVTAGNVLLFLVSVVLYTKANIVGGSLLGLNTMSVIICMGLWWRDVVREGTYEGNHTVEVEKGLICGMVLFILSEVCFFVAFFWAFFHSSMSPAIQIGGIWPPEDLVGFDPWSLPLLNTFILLGSGVTITWAHHELIGGNIKGAVIGMELTILLAIAFTLFQAYEYVNSKVTIADSIYGSTLFMATGFHGLHVIIGTTLLTVMLIRLYKGHFTREHHFGFEAAAWYWHFVDVVWLFLFVSIYWWGAI
jgi:cytochrome c oxidase subunit 3